MELAQEKNTHTEEPETKKEDDSKNKLQRDTESLGNRMEEEDQCGPFSVPRDVQIDRLKSSASNFSAMKRVPSMSIEIPNVGAVGRPRKKNFPKVKRQSYMKN